MTTKKLSTLLSDFKKRHDLFTCYVTLFSDGSGAVIKRMYESNDGLNGRIISNNEEKFGTFKNETELEKILKQ